MIKVFQRLQKRQVAVITSSQCCTWVSLQNNRRRKPKDLYIGKKHNLLSTDKMTVHDKNTKYLKDSIDNY